MVLYVGASLYHVLCFSVHKLLYHRKEEAVLVVGDNIFSKSGMDELKKDIESAGIFSRVVILKFIEGAYTNPYKIKPTSKEEQIQNFIKHNEIWIENWLSKQQLDLSQVTEFNSAIDHRHLGLYLLSKKIPYQYFEDGNGLLSREEVQLEFHRKAQYASYAVAQYLHALGRNEVVTKKYANVEAQVKGFHDEKMEDFHVIRLFQSMDAGDQATLIGMFHAEKLSLPEGKPPVLYLTRYVKYLQKTTMKYHQFLSAMILDLFAQGYPLVVKPHPRDFSGRYAQMFPDAVVLPKQFPSELLPFIYEGRYAKIITTGSTAIDALVDYSDQQLKLDVKFEEKFDAIYSYIAAVQFVKQMFPEIGAEQIGIRGCCRELLDPLCQQFLGFEISKSAETKKECKVILADEISEEEMPAEADCICYLNTKQDYQFADHRPEIFEKLHYINLSVRKREETSDGEEIETALFVETKNEEIAGRVESLYFKYTFHRAGMVMFAGNDTKERQEYMKIFSEILWLKCCGERGEENVEFPQIPRLRRRISKEDVMAMRQLLSVVKKRRKKNEGYGICTDEIK